MNLKRKQARNVARSVSPKTSEQTLSGVSPWFGGFWWSQICKMEKKGLQHARMPIYSEPSCELVTTIMTMYAT